MAVNAASLGCCYSMPRRPGGDRHPPPVSRSVTHLWL